MKIVLATRNAKKVEEIRRVLVGTDIDLLGLADFPPFPDVVEDGETFHANAIKKAVETARQTGVIALADDSGLVVDALDGRPGVHSARYAGPHATDRQNLEKLLDELKGRPAAQRSARFVCVLALAWPNGRSRTFDGSVEGLIGAAPLGENGFGYDPVFFPEGLGQTFAQMSAQQKDALSHRGRAIALFAEAAPGLG